MTILMDYLRLLLIKINIKSILFLIWSILSWRKSIRKSNKLRVNLQLEIRVLVVKISKVFFQILNQ